MAQLPYSKKTTGSNPILGFLSAKFACSLHVCVGFLWLALQSRNMHVMVDWRLLTSPYSECLPCNELAMQVG